MRKAEIEIGRIYRAKVSGMVGNVRILEEHPHGGWNAVNIRTRRGVRIRTAGRLHGRIYERCEEHPGTACTPDCLVCGDRLRALNQRMTDALFGSK